VVPTVDGQKIIRIEALGSDSSSTDGIEAVIPLPVVVAPSVESIQQQKEKSEAGDYFQGNIMSISASNPVAPVPNPPATPNKISLRTKLKELVKVALTTSQDPTAAKSALHSVRRAAGLNRRVHFDHQDHARHPTRHADCGDCVASVRAMFKASSRLLPVCFISTLSQI
jgi:hypothetical protein